MLLSMTGYGRAVREFGAKAYTVEVKTLNSKFLDLKMRLPQGYRSKEIEVRKLVTEMVSRGKVDISVEVKFLSADQSFVFDRALFKAYHKELSELSKELDMGQVDLAQAILRLPNVVSAGEDVISDEEWGMMKEVINEALEKLTKFRSDEGASLEADLTLRVTNIQELLEQVSPFEDGRIERLRERFRTQIDELVGSGTVDDNRLEQELIYYTEKFSLSEEKVRLAQHCVYFIEQLAEEKSASKGRRLNFISQEMGREINTLGSKANSADIQRIVVQMKDELEKIKEQVANAL